MKIKDSISERIFNIFNIIFMSLLAVITIYPIWYVLVCSFSDSNLLMAKQGLIFWPIKPNIIAYKAVIGNSSVITGYINTITILLGGVSISMFLTILGGYALSLKDLYWKKHIMVGIVFTMYFSGGLIPFYFTVKQFGMDNTLWALIVPTALSTFNLIIMRSSFESIPESLRESAHLDGAGEFTILFRIMVPLVIPTIAVLVLYYAVGQWNAWFNAMIFIRKPNLYPLALVLRNILIENDTNAMQSGDLLKDQAAIADTIKYAVIIIATAPILCVYPFVQKYFTKGVMIGAVKE